MLIQSEIYSPTLLRKLNAQKRISTRSNTTSKTLHESVPYYSTFPELSTRPCIQGHCPCFLLSFSFTIYIDLSVELSPRQTETLFPWSHLLFYLFLTFYLNKIIWRSFLYLLSLIVSLFSVKQYLVRFLSVSFYLKLSCQDHKWPPSS